MRISDWSSDVCSSDLPTPCPDGGIGRRTSFRCWRSQGRGGSSPLLGTICSSRNISKSVLSPQKSKGIGPWIVPDRPAFSRGFRTFLRAFCGPLRKPHREKRSEEHTSEPQSLMRISYAVFCLKTQKNQQFKTLTDS